MSEDIKKLSSLERVELACAQLPRNRPLQQGVGACGPAAHVRLPDGTQLGP